MSIHFPLYPNLRVHRKSDFDPDLIHDLLVSKVDLPLIANPWPNRRLTTSKVSEAPMYVVLPENCSLSVQETVALADLADYNWILFERKVHPFMYETIFRRGAEEEIIVQNGQSVDSGSG